MPSIDDDLCQRIIKGMPQGEFMTAFEGLLGKVRSGNITADKISPALLAVCDMSVNPSNFLCAAYAIEAVKGLGQRALPCVPALTRALLSTGDENKAKLVQQIYSAIDYIIAQATTAK